MHNALRRHYGISILFVWSVICCSALSFFVLFFLYYHIASVVHAYTIPVVEMRYIQYVLLSLITIAILVIVIASMYVVLSKKALRESRRDYYTLFEQAPDGIILLDEFGVIQDCNNLTEKLLGYSKKQLRHKHISEIYNGEALLWHMPNQKSGVDFVEAEIDFRTGTGDILPIWYRGTVHEGDATRFTGIILHIRDITERKAITQEKLQLEKDLNHARKMESIGTLAAGIAHEINTPIQFVGDNVYFLARTFDRLTELIDMYKESVERIVAGGSATHECDSLCDKEDAIGYDFCKEEMPQAFQETHEGLARVATIVNAMKDFAHKGVDEQIASDLNHAVETTITLSRNAWKEVAEIHTDFDPALPMVTCYLADVNQAIMNLILNAADAIKESIAAGNTEYGKIIVSTRVKEDAVVIAISDDGMGIPASAQARIFDPFFTTKAVGKGTGQGLALVYKTVVKKHHGKITFDTESKKGTTFYLELPVHKER